jgi:hypothetical protein
LHYIVPRIKADQPLTTLNRHFLHVRANNGWKFPLTRLSLSFSPKAGNSSMQSATYPSSSHLKIVSPAASPSSSHPVSQPKTKRQSSKKHKQLSPPPPPTEPNHITSPGHSYLPKAFVTEVRGQHYMYIVRRITRYMYVKTNIGHRHNRGKVL